MALRVAHFIETDVPGGAESMLLGLCEQSKAYDIEPIVIHFNHPFFNQECTKRGIEQVVIENNRFFKKTMLLPFFAIQLAWILKKNSVDVLHSHLFGPIVGGAMGAFLARVKSIGTLHDTYMIEEKPTRIRLLKLATVLRSKLVCVSKAMKDFYVGQGNFSNQEINVIYNSVPSIEIGTEPSNNKEIIITTTGRLVELKRIKDLISAANELCKKELPFKMQIVGEGPEKESLNRQIEKFGLKEKVKLLGFRQDISSLLKQSDIYVQCSRTEGLSMSILEAISTGLPCVVSNVGANSELVDDEESGYLFETGDVEALTVHLEVLIQNNVLRNKLSERSREKYTKLFSYQRFIKLYNDMYFS